MLRGIVIAVGLAGLAGCSQPQDKGQRSGPVSPPAKAPPTAETTALTPGLWETTTVDEAAGGTPEVSRVCVSEEQAKSPPGDFLKLDDPACSVTRSSGPGGETAHAECLKDGVRFLTDATWAARGGSYRLALTTRAVLPGGQVHEGRTRAEGRRLGDCPAGMRPGQIDADD